MKKPVLTALLALLLLIHPPVGCKRDPATQTTPPSPQTSGDAQAGDSTSASTPPSKGGTEAPTVSMRIGKETFHLEIADTDEEQRLGLMYRRSMPSDRGMIFVNEDEAERSFWMKNTFIPLDILYLDARGRVVSIKPMAPHDLNGVRSDGPAMYAVELNRGAAARAGVAVGDRLTIPPQVRRPPPSR